MAQYASADEIRAGIAAHQAHLDAHMVVDTAGREIKPGDAITSFRGEPWTFLKLTRAPGDGTATNGKILARTAGDSDDVEPWEGEYYPSVFDLKVVPRG